MKNKDNLVFENKKIKSKIEKDKSTQNNLQFNKETPKNKEELKVFEHSSNNEKKKGKANKKKEKNNLKVFIYSLLGLFLCGFIIFSIIIGNWLIDKPKLDTSLLTDVSQTSLIYDKNGELITSYSSYENREWVQSEDIPQTLKDAFISIEDKRFYKHSGIDIKRLASAVIGQITSGDDHGGSTLTQQLVKNVYLSSEVTYKRKVQEIVLSLELERKMSKDEILEAYLNIVYFGGSNYGVKAASKDYFGKELNELTVRECAMLAGLVQSPNGYNPRKNLYEKNDLSITNKRTDTVLYTMLDNKKITKEQYDNALKEEVPILEKSSSSEIYPYAHFVEYVLDEVATDLLKKEGKEITNTNLTYKKYSIRNGGYKIYTTLDTNIQNILQESAQNYTNYPQTDDPNGAQVSAVIMDQYTGSIVGMIGSKEKPIAQETFNRAVDSTQPIGSIMKPIGIFAPAIENNSSPGDILLDYQTNIEGYDGSNGYPGGSCSNYPMTIRKSLETSHNIAAARLLMEQVGIETSADYLIQMGINSKHISRTGAGIALGTSDLTTLETTGAFATLANGGEYIEPHSYTKVEDRKEKVILDSENTKIKRQVFSESTAWLITNMMESEVTNGSGTNANIDGITVAGKTGTHEDRVITFAGSTGYYTSVVRISSDTYASMYDALGGNQTAILWQQYMSQIHSGLKDRAISKKSAEELGIEQIETCNISGKLATDACIQSGHNISEYYLSKNKPLEYCGMHIAICTTTNLLAHEGCWNKGTIKIMTYVSTDNKLLSVGEDLLWNSIEGLTFKNITEKCYYNHYYIAPSTENYGESKKPNVNSESSDINNNTSEEIKTPENSESTDNSENNNGSTDSTQSSPPSEENT